MIDYREHELAARVSEPTYWWLKEGFHCARTQADLEYVLDVARCFFDVRAVTDHYGAIAYYTVRVARHSEHQS